MTVTAARDFDYKTANVDGVLGQGSALEGRTLGELRIHPRLVTTTMPRGAGARVERFFGIPANSVPGADFPRAGLELKVVPLRRTRKGFSAKERTFISIINYGALATESWASAHVRSKLTILLVFYEYLRNQPDGVFPIVKVHLWRPDQRIERVLKADWSRIQNQVLAGLAHELSGAEGRILCAGTKGANATTLRSQPFSNTKAMQRAYALKTAFTTALFKELSGSIGAVESLMDTLSITDADEFEQRLLKRFARFVGKVVGDVADELGVPQSNAYHFAAQVVHRAFGAKSYRTKILEFVEMGLVLRVPRVAPSLVPYEAVSFPAFRMLDLVDEQWEDSPLLDLVSYMTFVPAEGTKRSTPRADCIFRPPVFFRPSPKQLEGIREEWEMFRREISDGNVHTLPTAAQTRFIHVRPHGRRRSDVDEAPGIGLTTKRCFWLNKTFVGEILQDSLTS